MCIINCHGVSRRSRLPDSGPERGRCASSTDTTQQLLTTGSSLTCFPLDSMDDSLMVRLRLPREEANATPDKTATDGLLTQSPDHTSHDGDASDEQEEEEEGILQGRAKKRKKPTYTVRKEKIVELADEVVALRQELQALKVQQLRSKPITMDEKIQTVALRWRVTQSRLAIASAQSLMSSHSAQSGQPLLGDYIHLPRDPVERQQILEGLKAHKMDEALAFLAARCQHVDLRRQVHQFDSYEACNKDLISNHFSVTKIEEGGPSVRRVYEEMLQFVRTSEIALAERFGVVGVRESDPWEETIDAKQVRVLTSYPPNLLVEKNHVIYTQYFPRSHALDQPHGVLICDYVDQDDAHPYQPHERIRKDVSSVYMIVDCPATEADEPRAVTIVNWGFRRIHHSELATKDELNAIAQGGRRTYYDVMLHTVREKLACQV